MRTPYEEVVFLCLLSFLKKRKQEGIFVVISSGF